MSHTPSIDYTCPHCGAIQIYELVPMGGDESEQERKPVAREIPPLDFSCSRCGQIQTYMLVARGFRESAAG
jgi:hypothetical protein